MSANAEKYEPFGSFDTCRVLLGVSQRRQVDRLLLLDLGRGSVAHKQGFASPFHGQILALGYIGQFELDFGQGEDVGGWRHIGDDVAYNRFSSVGSGQTNTLATTKINKFSNLANKYFSKLVFVVYYE